MSRTVITHARLLALHPGAEFLDEATLVLEDGRVSAVLTEPDAVSAHAEVVDARGAVVLPGLVNAHTHACSALARGLPHPAAAADFAAVLRDQWWRFDDCLDAEEIEAAATLAACDGLRFGVTTVFDHHASTSCIRGALDAVGRGFERAGQRAVLCFEVSDRAGPRAARAALAENARWARTAPRGPFLLGAMLGLHASFTLGEETLERAAEVARDLALRVHIHLAEDLVDRVTGTASGSGVVERLARFGLWRPGSIAAHAVHLDDVERRRLGALGVVVAHCPRSNQHNGVGRCDLAALVRAGVQVALGTDGYAAGMLSEAQAAILVQRQAPRFGDGRAVEEGLLQANAELASSYLPGAGRLVPGSPADVVVTRYIPPTPLTAENVWAHLLLADIESRVRHVFVHGRLVVEDGRCRLLDEAELAARCRERAARLWERFAAASRAGGQS